MFMNFSRNLTRHLNRRTVICSKNKALCFRKNYFSFSLINRGFPNLNIRRLNLPCSYSTACVQVEESETTFKKKISGIKHYRKMLENDKEYCKYMFCLETVKIANKASTNKILLASRDLLQCCEEDISLASEEKLNNLKDMLSDEKRWLKFNELAEVIYNILRCVVKDSGTVFREQFMEILTVLDEECFERVFDISNEEKLFLTDLWYQYHKTAVNVNELKFTFKVKWKLFDWMKSLTKEQMLLFFYWMSAAKNAPKTNNDYRNYITVEKMFPLFTIEEIGLICFAYSRIQRYVLSTDGVKYILERLSQEIESCSEKSLKFIAKTLGEVLPYRDTSVIFSVQQKAANITNRLSVDSLLDILLISIKRMYNADKLLVEATLRQVKENMSDVSFAELNRLLYVLITINYNDEELFQLTAEKLRSEKNFDSLPYLSVVNSLVVFNVFLDDLLSEILSEGFYEKIEEKWGHYFWEKVCFIEMSVAIERPNCKYSRINEKKKRKILQGIRFRLVDDKKYRCGSAGYWLEESLTRICGSDKCHLFVSVVPHFGYNTVVLKIDKNLKGQDISESWKSILHTEILKPLDRDYYWLVLYLLRKCFYTPDDNLNAEAACMKRQIQALGFIPLPIPTSEFTILKSDDLKDQFIGNKLKEAIQSTTRNE